MSALDLFDLTGRVALVTGAARGLGQAMATALAEAGARLVIADINGPGAQVAAGTLRSSGHDAFALTVDVTQSADVNRMVQEALGAYGQIDILVNNAGINNSTPVLELTDDLWQRAIEVNLTGVFLCSQIVGAHMVERGYGRIINISSVAAHFGAPNLAAYSATKAGVLGLTRVMAVEWGPHGVTVNAICPGNIDTEMLRKVYEDRSALRGVTVESLIANITSKTPVGGLGTPSDVAATVLFLASPAAEYITGQAINVCGGRTINLS